MDLVTTVRHLNWLPYLPNDSTNPSPMPTPIYAAIASIHGLSDLGLGFLEQGCRRRALG